MRSVLIAITAALLFSVAGCDHHNLNRGGGCGSCGSCGNGGHANGGLLGGGGGRHGGGGLGGHAGGGMLGAGGGSGPHAAPSPVARLGHGYHNPGMPGPPTASYGYPYYTVRAPRDFLLDNPPSIGY